MSYNRATQKQSATMQCVDCDKNLNLNRVLNGPLTNYKLNYLNSSRSDAVETNERKQKKNN